MTNKNGKEIEIIGQSLKNIKIKREPSREFWQFAYKMRNKDWKNTGGFLEELQETWLYHKYKIYLDREQGIFVREVA